MFKKKYLILLLFFPIIMGLAFAPGVQAQNWANMPPYNLLGPLWSPTLSPPDPVTGVPTPILTELTGSTILPVQPVMALHINSYEWPMGIIMPWFFFNGPFGVIFFDSFYGLNLWPDPSFLDTAGNPIAVPLPIGWSYNPLPLLKESQYLFELANLTYLVAYGNQLNVDPASLLTFADIWGLPIFFAGGIP